MNRKTFKDRRNSIEKRNETNPGETAENSV